MEARYKLTEADYFLNKLKKLRKKPDEFMYNLSAFLSAWRSVFDFLLYDFAKKYFGWSREDRFYVRDFEVGAKISKIEDAQNFIQWYKKQSKLLEANPLWNKRVVTVHRGHLKVKRTYDVYAYPEPVYARPEPENSVKFFFKDYEDKDIIKICETAYEEMKKIVEEAKNTFK